MKKLILTLILSTFYLITQAQFNTNLFNSMKYRMIGPHRGGRTVGAVGVPQQPNVFYIGVNNGGVWKTNDYISLYRSNLNPKEGKIANPSK
jgi:hypothetical protein